MEKRPKIRISLEKIEGSVVDVGGGGEGVIAKACGRDTVSLDIRKGEIDEAKSSGAVAQWILCDARLMPFRNETFDAATFFFSLMYIKTSEKKRKVLMETRRVLKSNGMVYLWDAAIEKEPDPYILYVDVSLPSGEQISTGYGIGGEGKEQTLELVQELAEEAGLKVARTKSNKDWFEISFKRL